jgi:hypothetical protein
MQKLGGDTYAQILQIHPFHLVFFVNSCEFTPRLRNYTKVGGKRGFVEGANVAFFALCDKIFAG